MDADEFARLAALTRLKPAGREMARRVLIEGLRAAEVARQMRVAPQTVRDKLEIIANALRAEQGAPAGWQLVTVLVPPAAVREVLDIQRREQQAER